MMDLIETVPKMELAIPDIAHVVEAWRDSHALSSPLLQRRAHREAAHTSLQGLLNSVRLNFCMAVELSDASGQYERSIQLPWPIH